MTEPSLESLRGRLDAIDAELVSLLRRRLDVVAEVRDAKRRGGEPAFDRARERMVLDGALARARELGVPQGLVTAVMTAILDASCALQGETAAVDAAETDARRLLIVGGRGRMGRMLASAFSLRGHTVDVLDQGDALDPARVAAADVVIVAVPMTVAVEVARALAPLVRPDALLCDINSTKRDVCAELARSQGEALGTHPMFGPTVRSLRRQKVVVCRVKPGPMSAWLEAELARMGAELVVSDPDAHDRMMSVVQGLTHFGIMVMGATLARSGLPLATTLAYMSPIYRLEVAMVGRLFSQAAELYQEILISNPHAGVLRESFVEEARALAERLARGDRSGFAAEFRATADYFADFAREAMSLTDDVIEVLVRRP